MTTRVGDLYADLSLRMTKFSSGLQQGVREVERAGQQMQNAVGPQLQEATERSGKKLQQFTWQVRGFMKDTSRVVTGILISQGFYKLINSIQEATSTLFKFNDEMQRAAISFSILLKSEQEAAVFMEALRRFAEETPFTFEQAEMGARRLMAMGFAAKNVIPIMRDVADMTAVVGGSAETLERITRAFGQIKTKGRLMAEELRQLHEVGVPALEILKEELGLTQDQLENIGDYKIPADAAIMALLKGIQKNFGGAAAKMEQTTGAIVTRIGERLLFLGNELFKNGFEGIRQRLSGFADALGNALSGARLGGISQALAALVPPEMHGSVMRIVGSLQSLWKSLGNLWQAIRPVVSAFGEMLLRSLSIILPIVAAVANVFSNMARTAMNASPAIRWLAGAIAGLAIAGAVTLLVEKLYMAISLLTVSGPIATLVLNLRNAIIALSAAMMRNPWIALATVAAAALLSIAMSSKVVTQWLDEMMARLAALGGEEYQSVFNAQDPQDMAAAINKYNEDLAKMGIDLSKVGKEAEKSGNKVKDKFLASFDEVHQIPDQMDSVNTSFEDMLKLLAGNQPQIPGGPGTGGPNEGGAKKPIFKMPDKVEMPPLVWPTPPTSPPPGAVATAIVATVVAMMQQQFTVAEQRVRDFVDNVSTSLQNVSQSFSAAGERVRQFVDDMSLNLSAAGSAVKNFTSNTITNLQTWGTQLMLEVQLWGVGVYQSVVDSLNRVVQGFKTWSNDVKLSVVTTVNNVRERLGMGMESARIKVEQVLTGMADFWDRHKGLILGIVGALAIGILLVFTGMTGGLGPVLAGLAILILGTFSDTKVAVAAETGEMKTNTVDQYEVLKQLIRDKVNQIYEDTVNKFKQLGKDLVQSFKDSVNSKIEDVKTAAQGLLDKFMGTIKDLPSMLMNTVKSAIQGIIDYISSVRLPSISVGTSYVGGGGSGGGTGSTSNWSSGSDIRPGDALRDVVSDVSYDPNTNTVSIGGQTFQNGSIPGTSLNNGVTTITDPGAFRDAVGLKYGGITTRDSLYRLSEGNKKEAVIPLNEQGLAPLVNAVARSLLPALEAAANASTRTGQQRQLAPLNVGVLIADDMSMRAFARKLKPYMDDEDIRIYGTTVRGATT